MKGIVYCGNKSYKQVNPVISLHRYLLLKCLVVLVPMALIGDTDKMQFALINRLTQNSELVEILLTFQLDARKTISAKNCLIRPALWMSSIPLLPFLISGFVEPHNMDTKHSQNASPDNSLVHIIILIRVTTPVYMEKFEGSE